MEILKYLSISLLSIGFIIIFVFALRTRKAIKMLFLNSFIGLSVFAILYFTRKYIGLTLHINEFTVIGSAVFGIPAIICFLLFNLIF